MDTNNLDKSLELLQENKDRWAKLQISTKIDFIDQTILLTSSQAEEWVSVSLEAKGIKENSPLSSEEWLGGPYAFLNWLHYMKNTLTLLDKGKSPIHNLKINTRMDGQIVATVYPNNWIEKLILNHYSIDVWMQKDVTSENIENTIASFYKKDNPMGDVLLILGAGNVSSIVPLDILYKLYGEGKVALIKMNPVNDYLGPIFEKIFNPFIENGFIQFSYGDSDAGEYLTNHELVDCIHITGSSKTHDTIVFGRGKEVEKRKLENKPINKKPISSELGGVSPTIVVPGLWSESDFKFQAEHIATQKLQNSGHNCIATQILILPKDWFGTGKLLRELENQITNAEKRPAYYPGSKDRHNTAREHTNAKCLDSKVDRTIIYDTDKNADEPCFKIEYFSPVLATVSIAGNNPSTFIHEAVKFSNEKLYGTLGANIIIDPKTARKYKSDLDLAITDLKYGSIGVNTWCALAFLAAGAAWGAYPGHTLDNIQSGIGVVHNAFLFGKSEKTVATGPFRDFPRSLLHGEFHLAPKPPWFISNKTAGITAKRLTYFAEKGKLTALPGIFTSALRG